jgi:hypothetical protein
MYRTTARRSVSERATPVVMKRSRPRLVAIVSAVAVFAAAAVGFVTGVAAGGDPGVRTMDKILPFKQDFGAYNAASVADIRAWVQQYGKAAGTIPNMPDVGAATPEQRAAATDLLNRTEAGTAAFNDPAAAKAAGYDINPLISNAYRAYHGATGKAAMMHVQKAHRNGAVLDPNAPDDLMYDLQGDGSWKLDGVMYLADGAYPGPPPTPGGPITRWHYHPRMAMKHLAMHLFFVPGNDLAQAYTIDMDMDGMGSGGSGMPAMPGMPGMGGGGH